MFLLLGRYFSCLLFWEILFWEVMRIIMRKTCMLAMLLLYLFLIYLFLECLTFSPFGGLSMNNRNSCDKLSASSKDAGVLKLLPVDRWFVLAYCLSSWQHFSALCKISLGVQLNSLEKENYILLHPFSCSLIWLNGTPSSRSRSLIYFNRLEKC